jgi:voltage-gated potassium channel
MDKMIGQLTDHIIVCGVGSTGSNVVLELAATRTPFVMIDSDEEQLQALSGAIRERGQPALYVIGDATEDRVLIEAGIEAARGLVAALRNDKDNIYIILSARQINPKLRIIARAMEKDAPPKILRAGADQVVSPNLIGGMRIASEMLRPEVVEFLDMMMRDMDMNTRIEQVSLPPSSPLAGKKLMDTNIRKTTDVLVIAIRDIDGRYIYNPGPEAVLSEAATLIVLGDVDSIIRLRQSVGGNTNRMGLID